MKKYIAEFFGTFWMVFVGTGSVIIDSLFGGSIGVLGIGIAFGLVVMTVIYSIGERSGAHINPAVTFGFCLNGNFPKKDLLGYFSFQFAGAALASFLLFYLFPESKTMGETIPSSTLTQAFLIELVLTLALMFVILNVADGSKEKGFPAAIAIGGTVAMEAIVFGPVTGASMNPARSFGPALISGDLEFIPVYFLAHFIGVALAVVLYKFLKK